jgi:hypothetical protein
MTQNSAKLQHSANMQHSAKVQHIAKLRDIAKLRRIANFVALFSRQDRTSCAACRHFERDPRRIEAMLPGLTSLGSASASVAADDGICLRHDTYQSGRYRCGDFAPRR